MIVADHGLQIRSLVTHGQFALSRLLTLPYSFSVFLELLYGETWAWQFIKVYVGMYKQPSNTFKKVSVHYSTSLITIF